MSAVICSRWDSSRSITGDISVSARSSIGCPAANSAENAWEAPIALFSSSRWSSTTPSVLFNMSARSRTLSERPAKAALNSLMMVLI